MKNTTLRYEFDFIHYFNNKTFRELSTKWRKHLQRIFPTITEDTVINCYKHENYFAKGDVDLHIKGQKKIISLKNGRNTCMHRERFASFYHFLKDLGVSDFTLSVLTLYQFGACRTFGHEDKPLTREEIGEKYGPLLKKANKELNSERIIDAIIDRAVITGKQEYRLPMDYLYYGNLEKGILISVDQIYELVKSRKELSSSWIHFGQLVFQPAARSRDNDDYLESTIRWPVLGKLFYITKDEDDVVACKIDG